MVVPNFHTAESCLFYIERRYAGMLLNRHCGYSRERLRSYRSCSIPSLLAVKDLKTLRKASTFSLRSSSQISYVFSCFGLNNKIQPVFQKGAARRLSSEIGFLNFLSLVFKLRKNRKLMILILGLFGLIYFF